MDAGGAVYEYDRGRWEAELDPKIVDGQVYELENGTWQLKDAQAAPSNTAEPAPGNCVSHCPQELDIPWLLELYNEHISRPDFKFIAPMALAALPQDKQPSACVGCGSCAAVCPQQIDIPGGLDDFAQLMASAG